MVKWTTEQLSIFDVLKNTRHNLTFLSTAGSGKSTTLVECVRQIRITDPNAKILLVSFSSEIVKTLKEKLRDVVVDISTLHSKGLSILSSHNKDYKLNDGKSFTHFMSIYRSREKTKPYKDICKLVMIATKIFSFARMSMCEMDKKRLIEMCDYFSLDYTEVIINDVINNSKILNKSKTIDFTDMVFLPTYLGFAKKTKNKYDYILLDEAQDINESQKQLVLALLKPDGRFICAGDTFQSIYGFAGSTPQSFRSLMEMDNMISLPLTTSFRCAKAIVREANSICTTMRAHSTNEEGSVEFSDVDSIEKCDMVLSRTTVPLVELFFQLMVNKIPARVVGKDIEENLVSLVEKSNSHTLDDFSLFLDIEQTKIERDLISKGIGSPEFHPRMVRFIDTLDAFNCIIKRCKDMIELKNFIKEIFADKEGSVNLMTIHRSKGLENERVFLIRSYNQKTLMPHPRAFSEIELEQERNLMFVAITRAKKKLFNIDLLESIK